MALGEISLKTARRKAFRDIADFGINMKIQPFSC